MGHNLAEKDTQQADVYRAFLERKTLLEDDWKRLGYSTSPADLGRIRTIIHLINKIIKPETIEHRKSASSSANRGNGYFPIYEYKSNS